MKLAQSRLTARGQVSVPAEVRRRLALVPGSSIAWDAEDDKVVIRRIGQHSSEDVHRALFSREPTPRTLEDLLGCTGYRGPRRSLADMEAAIRHEAKARR